jgi:exoribonuclease R
MRTIADPDHALARGLAAIRADYQVPAGFPPAVTAAAEVAARRRPNEHADRTALPFVTLDPAGATDLDQAFAVEPAGGDMLLRYAIADVAFFVDDGGPIDAEAWVRGETLYLPDGKAPLHPPVLSEGAASLLPDGDRPAILFHVRIAPDGAARLDGVERALVRSRAKLAYETVTVADPPAGFDELARRIQAAETARGAARVDPPEQQVEAVEGGGYTLGFRPILPSENSNAALSLATNLAVADALLAHRTGLFRVMAGPDEAAVGRLRRTARALGLAWPEPVSLTDYQRTLDPHDPKQAAFMLALRRAGDGAGYASYQPGVTPWHAAMAATYAQATAPLRRLADRYVCLAALAVANGQAVSDEVEAAFARLPKVMARADAKSGQVDRAVVDLAEAVMLEKHVGESFGAVVTDADERGVRIQLRDLPVVARIAATGPTPGESMTVRLDSVDSAERRIGFSLEASIHG